MENMELVLHFLDELKNRGTSPNTVGSYRARLERLAEHLGGLPITEAKRQDIQEFISALRRSGLSNQSIAAYVAAMRSFGAWLEVELWESQWRNIFRTIRYPRKHHTVPQTIAQDDVLHILSHMPNRTTLHKRNRAIFSLLYDTGLRVSELASLSIYDVDIDSGIVRVNNGKGGKDRYSFFGQRTRQALEEWLAERETTFDCGGDALFVGRGSARLSRQQIENIVRQAGKRVGLTVTPHTLRRSRATHLRNAGVPVDVISLMLGHSSPDVTEAHYLNEDPAKIREILFGVTGG